MGGDEELQRIRIYGRPSGVKLYASARRAISHCESIFLLIYGFSLLNKDRGSAGFSLSENKVVLPTLEGSMPY